MSERVEEWWASGSVVTALAADGEPVELFVRVAGRGPTVTLLHGYPSSSFDWRHVSCGLEEEFQVVAIDLLGFGRSTKPWPHAYGIVEQTDLVAQIWDHLGVRSTHLVVHDYSSSVGQELLARGDVGRPASVTFLNGAVYPHLHRPTEAQQLLRGPGGDDVAQAVDAALFAASVRPTFGPRAPVPDEVVDDMWFTVSHDGGQQLAGALLHYIDDRAVHGTRWVHAMERAPVPIAFVWGPDDPVSGAHVLAEIRERMPDVAVSALEGVGHWPMLEDADGVRSAVRTTIESAG